MVFLSVESELAVYFANKGFIQEVDAGSTENNPLLEKVIRI